MSTYDSGYGAARAAYRIHRALLDAGVDSRMRVLRSGVSDGTVTAGSPSPSLRARLARSIEYRRLSYAHRDWHTDNPIIHTFGQTGAGLVDELNASNADILNLHWISRMLSVRDIGRLQKPIVWTLHDMWAFCGGEHLAPDEPGRASAKVIAWTTVRLVNTGRI